MKISGEVRNVSLTDSSNTLLYSTVYHSTVQYAQSYCHEMLVSPPVIQESISDTRMEELNSMTV